MASSSPGETLGPVLWEGQWECGRESASLCVKVPEGGGGPWSERGPTVNQAALLGVSVPSIQPHCRFPGTAPCRHVCHSSAALLQPPPPPSRSPCISPAQPPAQVCLASVRGAAPGIGAESHPGGPMTSRRQDGRASGAGPPEERGRLTHPSSQGRRAEAPCLCSLQAWCHHTCTKLLPPPGQKTRLATGSQSSGVGDS